jgi:gas vesicle protein
MVEFNKKERLVVGGLLFAVLTGAALGILFAPHKGKKTRKIITDSVKKNANRFNQELKQKGNSLKDKLVGVKEL